MPTPREVGLQILATARAALGDLDRVTRVVKVLGMVNCTPDFEKPAASDQRLFGSLHRGLRRSGEAYQVRRRVRGPTRSDSGRDRVHDGGPLVDWPDWSLHPDAQRAFNFGDL